MADSTWSNCCLRHCQEHFATKQSSRRYVQIDGLLCFPRNDGPMTPRTATLIGLTAILMWSLLSVLTVATGKVPAFQLAAMTFAIGAAVAFTSFIWRPQAFGALKQPLA